MGENGTVDSQVDIDDISPDDQDNENVLIEDDQSDQSDQFKITIWLKTFLLVTGFSLVAISLWGQREGWQGNWQWGKWLILVLGLIVFILGRRMSASKAPPVWIKNGLTALSNWFGIKDFQIFFLLLGPVLTIVTSLAAGDGFLMRNAIFAVVTWLAAIGFSVAGGWRSCPAVKVSKRTAYTLTALIVGAFLVRVIRISSIPIVLSGDEASAGFSAIEFIEGKTNNIFRVGWYSFPTFYFFIQSIPIKLLGQTTYALRLSSAIAGALTVGVLYWTVKAMFNQRTALLSAIFLAALHYHNHFSRIGLNNVWDGLWFVVVLGLLWYGWERENRLAFLLAGFSLGLSQYFYVSGRALFLLVPFWVFVAAILDWPKFKRNLPDVILLELVAIVTFFPLARYFIQHPDEFMAPMRKVSILGTWLQNEVHLTGKPGWQIVLRQITLSFLGYTHIPIQFWYKPFEPILRFLPAVLFFLGLVSLFPKLRQSRSILILSWLVTIGLMGGLSESTPAAQRYVAVAPVLAIVVGYGLSVLAAELAKILKTKSIWVTVLAGLVMLGLGFDEIRFYWIDYTPRSEFGGVNSRVAQHLADYLQDKSGQYEVIFFGQPRMGYRSIPSIQFLAPHVDGVDVVEPWESGAVQPAGDHLVFVFLPENQDELESVIEDYPSGELVKEKDRQNELLYVLYEVSPDG
jgi:4-amino-4-deoxy-L-arabinose transferase-like glycosyltransferase